MEENNKQNNGRKYSHNEEEILFDLIEAHKEVLESEETDAVTWKNKVKTWAKVAHLFATIVGEKRSSQALRDEYTDLKKKTCSEFAAEKREEKYLTGGGMENSSNVSPLSEQIGSISQVSPTGLQNSSGDDSNEWITMNIKPDCILEEDVKECQKVAADNSEKNPKGSENWNLNKKINDAKERVTLVKLQQKYYEEENIRAAEKHSLEMEKHRAELKGIRMRNKLIEIELLEALDRKDAN